VLRSLAIFPLAELKLQVNKKGKIEEGLLRKIKSAKDI
jgi:hypothetical protein